MAELRIENDDQKKVVPSGIYNNLATVGGLRVFGFKKEAVVLKSTSVRLLSLDARTNGGKKRGTVTHVGAALVEGKLTASVTSVDGVELWDLAKEILVSSTAVCPPQSDSDASANAAPIVPQCTAFGVNNGASFIATGTSAGEVAFYSVNGELQTTPLGRTRPHDAAVMTIGTSPNPASPIMAASGDANGTVIMWGRNMAVAVVIPSPQKGDSVTGIVSNGTYYAVGYGGGKLRLFSAANGSLVVEVAAHARWMNAVAVAPNGQHVATCGDDGMVFVWSMPSDANGHRIALAGQKFIKNYLWTGLAFGDVGELFANAYDVDRAYTFSY